MPIPDYCLSQFTGPEDIAVFIAFCVVAVLLTAGFVGWLCEREQPPYRRTVTIDPALGDFVDEPTEPIPSIVRRQGPARRVDDLDWDEPLLADEQREWVELLTDTGAGDA